MAGPNCHNCVYSLCDPELWLRWLRRGEPILPLCANHPRWPGQLHEVPGVPCRNYRRKSPVPQGDVRLIPLAEGLYAYVDAADYEWLSQWQWHMCAGGYAGRVADGGTILMHRVIMQPPPGMVVDHIDGNKANNCRFNLRVCTRKENQRNMRKQRGARSPFKGVYYDKRRGKFFAQFYYEGKVRWLGYFPTEVEAARAYDRGVVEWFGPFARVNFPQEWPPERRREVHAAYQAALKRQARRATPKAKAKGKRNTSKAKAKGNPKKAKARRKPRPARRKRKELPRRPPRRQSRRKRG
jgi:hypothetical protein